MVHPLGDLTLEDLEGIARAAGLTIEQEQLQELLVQIRSTLQDLYEVDDETLRTVEPFHILPLRDEG